MEEEKTKKYMKECCPREIGLTEEVINQVGMTLQIAEKENRELKDKGKFNLQQANYTMKRALESLGGYFVRILREAENINKTNSEVKE